MKNDGERELPEGLAVAKSPQAVAEILDIGLLRLIDQNISRIRLRRVIAHLRYEASLRDVEVTTSFHYLFPRLVCWRSAAIPCRP